MHNAHTYNPGHTHTTRAVPISWALLRSQQACRTHVARMLGLHLSRHAQAACPQVATSLRCRDIKAARIMSRHQIMSRPPGRPSLCRDIKLMSRPRSCPQWDFQVATPKSMSRRRFCPTKADQVATPLPVATSACRDLQTRSRPSAGNWH